MRSANTYRATKPGVEQGIRVPWMDEQGLIANDHAILEEKKRPVCERATLGAHRCEQIHIEDHESALIAAWKTSSVTMLAGQTTLRASAAASDARRVATGRNPMKLRLYVSCTHSA